MFTLHVTNGDSAAEGMARSGLPGDVLAWRDILHDGAVPPDDDREAFWQVRAQFISSGGWAREQEVFDDFASRDTRLDGLTGDDAIVLWFEPDLYDQLQLIQVLSRMAQRSPDQRPRLFIVPADVFLGPLDPSQFPPLFEARRTVVDEDLAHARLAWNAFTSTTPDALVSVASRLEREVPARRYDADEHTRLPHLAAALVRMLEEYPDAQSGLSRSERQICECLLQGETTLSTLYPAAHHKREEWAWLGDSSFGWYVERLSNCAQPLVMNADGTTLEQPDWRTESREFWQSRVGLTPFGHEVVQGRADAVRANGIDRWIGGAHLMTARHWRWDAANRRAVSRP
jgi:hypothetical protein